MPRASARRVSGTLLCLASLIAGTPSEAQPQGEPTVAAPASLPASAAREGCGAASAPRAPSRQSSKLRHAPSEDDPCQGSEGPPVKKRTPPAAVR